MQPPDSPLTFEWDESKNKQNIAKHSLDFADAQDIFDNPILRRVDNRQDYGEERFIAYGEFNGHVVAIIYTIRKRNIYSIISFRRARGNERRAYYLWSQRYEKQD